MKVSTTSPPAIELEPEPILPTEEAQPAPALPSPPIQDDTTPRQYANFLDELNATFNQQDRTDDVPSILARLEEEDSLAERNGRTGNTEAIHNERFGRDLRNHTEHLKEITHQLKFTENPK